MRSLFVFLGAVIIGAFIVTAIAAFHFKKELRFQRQQTAALCYAIDYYLDNTPMGISPYDTVNVPIGTLDFEVNVDRTIELQFREKYGWRNCRIRPNGQVFTYPFYGSFREQEEKELPWGIDGNYARIFGTDK